jgi:MarR family 2-MHQ and catechol resistance regulon transcriptional repressor
MHIAHLRDGVKGEAPAALGDASRALDTPGLAWKYFNVKRLQVKPVMGTAYRGTRHEVQALDAYIKLMRAAGSVMTRVHRHLTEERLSASQFGVLEALHHLGPLSQRELGRKILKSSGNITMVVDNLERRRLVRRERGGGDRRVVTAHLTDAGRRVIRSLFPRHVAGILREIAVLTPAEQAELGRLCRKLGKRELHSNSGDASPARKGRDT